MNNPVIIIVDMLNEFGTKKLKVKGTKYIIQNLQKLIDVARKKYASNLQ